MKYLVGYGSGLAALLSAAYGWDWWVRQHGGGEAGLLKYVPGRH